MMKQLSEDQLKDIVSDYFSEDWAQDKALLLLDHFTNLVKESPVADERAAIQHHVDLVKAYGDQLYCKASASNPTDKNSWSKSAEAVLSNVAESYRAALASAPVAGEALPRSGYAGVTVWVGDRQVTTLDELLERFEVARTAACGSLKDAVDSAMKN